MTTTTSDSEIGHIGDEVNKTIFRAETCIRRMNFGAVAEIRLDDERFLGFGKNNGSWSIYVKRGDVFTSANSCSIRVRKTIIERIPELIFSLNCKYVENKHECFESIVKASAFLDSVCGLQPGTEELSEVLEEHLNGTDQ